MQDFFKDIFQYHNHFNQKLIDLFTTQSEKVSERTISLFSHCLNAHQIWNARISGTEPFGVHQIHSLTQMPLIDNTNYADTLRILSDFDLSTIINYRNSKGDVFENAIREILFHIANHFSHHKGQIISDLRQNGIEPIVTDYIFYKRVAE